MTDGWLKALAAVFAALAGLLAWWGRRARAEALLVGQAKCDDRHERLGARLSAIDGAISARPETATRASLAGAYSEIRRVDARVNDIAVSVARLEAKVDAQGESLDRIETRLSNWFGDSGPGRKKG